MPREVMSPSGLVLVELADRRDDLLLPWLDLYETAFPAREKMLVSKLMEPLRERESGRPTQTHLLAALYDGSFGGLVVYAVSVERLASLWYLAMVPEKRNLGLGAQVYQAVVQRLAPDCRAMLLEVEDPDEATTAEAEMARRRLGFYRRQGARLLGGISYLQSVGPHQPLTPMHVMVHMFEPMSPDEAFVCAKTVFGEAITQVGPLVLE